MLKYKNTIATLFGAVFIIILLHAASVSATDWQSFTESKIVTSPQGSNALNAPIIENIPSKVDADTYVISGITLPNAKVTAMGGPYDLPPTTADSSGNFRIEVALIQNQVNQYMVKVESSGKFAPDVTVYIVEGVNEKKVEKTTTSIKETTLLGPKGKAFAEDRTYDYQVWNQPVLEKKSIPKKVLKQPIVKFSDVSEKAWFYKPINKLRKRGVISGYKNGKFGPGDPVTRGQMMKIACNATGLNIKSFNRTLAFSDIKDDNPFLRCIHAASQKGWVGGYANGTFGVDDKVTRGQAAKIIVNAFELDLIKPTKLSFPDVKVSDWFYPYVETLSYHKILTGYGDGTFKPGKILNRAEISKIIIKTAENSNVGITAGFSSVELGKDDCKVIAKISNLDEAALAKSLSEQETLSSLIANFQDTYDAAKEISVANDIQAKIKQGLALTMKDQAFVNMANSKKEYEILLTKAKAAKKEYDAINKKATTAVNKQTPAQKDINKNLANKLTKMTHLGNTVNFYKTEQEIISFLDVIPVEQQVKTNEYTNEADKALGKWWDLEESALKRYKEYLQAEKVYLELWVNAQDKKTDISSMKKYLKDLDDHLVRTKRRVNKSGKSAIEGAKKQCASENL